MRVGITYLGVESERDVFELPEIGDAYWHGWEAARVHDVHGAAVPCIELVPDRE